MKLSQIIVSGGLFLAGLAGGWFTPAPGASDVSLSQIPPVAIPTGNGALEPSGLAGDLSHLPFREAWELADESGKMEILRRWGVADPEDAVRYFALELVNGVPRDPERVRRFGYRWAESDPARFMTVLNSMSGPIPDCLDQCLETACGASGNQESLLEFWKSARPELNRKMRRGIFDKLFDSDPRIALN